MMSDITGYVVSIETMTGMGRLTRHADGEVGRCTGFSLLLWCFSEPRLDGKHYGYPATACQTERGKS